MHLFTEFLTCQPLFGFVQWCDKYWREQSVQKCKMPQFPFPFPVNQFVILRENVILRHPGIAGATCALTKLVQCWLLIFSWFQFKISFSKLPLSNKKIRPKKTFKSLVDARSSSCNGACDGFLMWGSVWQVKCSYRSSFSWLALLVSTLFLLTSVSISRISAQLTVKDRVGALTGHY